MFSKKSEVAVATSMNNLFADLIKLRLIAAIGEGSNG
jgi:hypothetical protein